jgi:di/tricarboxylate transporter
MHIKDNAVTEYQIWIVFAILTSGLILFVWQRIRYDIVAALMLLSIGLTGIISVEEIFSGFASPAVITVAAALVIAKSLENSGILDKAEAYLLRFEKRPMLPFLLLLLLVSLVSGFINDIAALAITLPIALSLARSLKLEPSKILIPLAYASIIGGSLTLIGTASNIVMGTIAKRELDQSLGIFEFFPVGLALTFAFIVIFLLIGKRVLPTRTSSYGVEKFELPKYIAEVQIMGKSKFLDKTIGEFERECEGDIEVVRIVRERHERDLPHSNTRIGLGDVLVIRSEAEVLQKITKDTGLNLIREQANDKTKELQVIETVVLPSSILIDKTARQIYLRDRFNVALLGIARHGSTLTKRVDDIQIKIGDVLLLEVAQADLQNVLQELQCAPLHKRGISLHARAPPMLTLVIAGVSIGLTAFGILPVEMALAVGAVAMLVLKSISLREAYAAIQWPILILIGSIIPFGIAMKNTGADRFIAEQILLIGISEPIMALAIVFIATTLLSNVINNVAAAVFMAPVALQLSDILGIAGLPMLMAVIFGAAVPYLTPISHHSNLLVMEAGGYKFTDYLRLGIPLTAVTAGIVVFLVPILWPFQ